MDQKIITTHSGEMAALPDFLNGDLPLSTTAWMILKRMRGYHTHIIQTSLTSHCYHYLAEYSCSVHP